MMQLQDKCSLLYYRLSSTSIVTSSSSGSHEHDSPFIGRDPHSGHSKIVTRFMN